MYGKNKHEGGGVGEDRGGKEGEKPGKQSHKYLSDTNCRLTRSDRST